MHALREFVNDYPEMDKNWYTNSNYLGWLSVKNEHDLTVLMCKASGKGLKVSSFREPDIGDRLTAIAIGPSEEAKNLCANLPLALKS